MRAAIALAALLVSCGPTVQDAYPDCATVATGGVVCTPSAREAWIVEQGLLAWGEVYDEEWGGDAVTAVLSHVAVVWAPIEEMERCPCTDGCHVAGCCDINGRWPTAWVNTRTLWGAWAWPPWSTALQHEVVHAAEWELEGSVDYEHDDHPRRWGELLDAARARWAERLGDG